MADWLFLCAVGETAMKDPNDKQTAALPLEPQKRGRGRPTTGQAMTPAEKQRAYRKRLADQQKSQVPAVQLEKVRSTAAEYLEKLGQQLADAKAENEKLMAMLEAAQKEIRDWTARALQAEKGNVTKTEKPGKPKKGTWVLQMKNTTVPGARWKSITTGDGWATEESAKKSEENIREKFPEDKGRFEYRVHKVT